MWSTPTGRSVQYGASTFHPWASEQPPAVPGVERPAARDRGGEEEAEEAEEAEEEEEAAEAAAEEPSLLVVYTMARSTIGWCLVGAMVHLIHLSIGV